MDNDDISTSEQRIRSILVDYDEALARGMTPRAPATDDTDPDLANCLERGAACVRFLERVWPRAGRKSRYLSARSSTEAAASSSPAAPQKIGRFHILRELGHGGFGIVFLAFDPTLRREVALKVPRPHSLMSPDVCSRFVREAHASAGLGHPNIVPVYEAGDSNSVCYLATAYCRGPTLAQWLKDRQEPVPVPLAASLLADLAEAVQHAHSRGVVHRDLKPGNVLLEPCEMPSEEGHGPRVDAWNAGSGRAAPSSFGFRPMITDFGLAKTLFSVGPHETAGGVVEVTETGVPLGTASYMAPEQAEGRKCELAVACDVYGLGTILYELLTGRPPFQGETTLDILAQVRSEEPVPPSRLRARVPRDVNTICMKCLEKDPARRYSSAGELSEDLLRFLESKPIHARPIGTPERLWRACRRNPRVALLGTTVLVLLAVVAIVSTVSAFWIGQARTLAVHHFNQAEEQRKLAEHNFLKARDAVDRMLTSVGQDRLEHVPQMEQVRRELLEDALRFYQEFLEVKGAEPAIKRETGRAYWRVGEIQRLLGHRVEAEHALRQSVSMCEELIAAYPERPIYLDDLASCLQSLGVLNRRHGDHHAAESAYVRALDVLDYLIAEFADNPMHRWRYAQIQSNVGLLQIDARRFVEAERTLRDSLSTRRQVPANFPSISRRQLGDASTHLALGTAFRATGRYEDAESECRQSITLHESLLDEAEHSEVRAGLAVSLNNLGNVLSDTGRLDEAASSLRQAIEYFERLAAQFPYTPAYRLEVARGKQNLAATVERLEQFDETRQLLSDAVRIAGRLCDAFPGIPEYSAQLAIGYSAFGSLLFDVGELEAAEQAQRQALGLSNRLSDQFPDLPGHRRVSSSIYTRLGILLRARGRLAESETAYRSAIDLQQAIAQQLQDVPDFALEQTIASMNLSNLLTDMGKYEEAKRLSQQAVACAENMSALGVSLPAHTHALATSHSNRASVLRIMGQWPEAEQHSRRAIDLLAQLADKFPNRYDYHSEWAFQVAELALLLQETGRTREAKEHLERARTVQQRLADQFPGMRSSRYRLARTLGSLGETVTTMGQYEEGEAHLRYAASIVSALVNEFAGVPQYEYALAMNENSLGLVLGKNGQRTEAERVLRKASQRLERLLANSPDAPDYRRETIQNCGTLGVLLRKWGRPGDAKPLLDRCVTLAESLAEAIPGVPQHRQWLASSLNTLGSLQVQMGQRDEAEVSFRRALTLREKLVADLPLAVRYRAELAESYHNLAALLRADGHSNDAGSLLEEAIAIREKLLAEYPEISQFKQELAGSLKNQANILRAANRLGEAESAMRRAIALLEDLATRQPAVEEYTWELADCYSHLGLVERAANRSDSAERSYRAALTTYQKAALNPNSPDFLLGIARTSYNLANLLRQVGRRDEAKELYRAALAGHENQVALFPDSPSLNNHLANTQENLAGLLAASSELDQAKLLLDDAIRHHWAAFNAMSASLTFQRDLTRCLQNRADIMIRLGDHAATVTVATELAQMKPGRWQNVYTAARIIARAASLAERDPNISSDMREQTTQNYHSRVLTLLGSISANRGFPTRDQIEQEQDFASLRTNEAFRQFLTELGRQR
jgi:eukaryotic-like serine/threonine-protein kinase